MLNYLKYFFPHRVKTPIYLIQFVTSRCMGKCSHCFFWREINRAENPMSPSEIYKTASGMGDVLQWLITGGEPYLREDLDEVVRAFYRAKVPYNIAIATSGYFPDKIADSVERLLFDCPRSNFIYGLPLEGIGELNDEIRGVKGFFERTTESIRRLKELKNSLSRSQKSRLTILVDITLSRLNQDSIEDTYRYIRDVVGPDVINVILARGAPRDDSAALPDAKIFRRINAIVDADIRSGKNVGYGGFTKLINAKDAVLRKTIADTYERKGRYFPCAAGKLIGVVTTEGDVTACELLPDVFGNLRESNYDFEKIWTSAQAESFRGRIAEEHCRCTHQCFLSPSIFFHPIGFAQIGMELMKSYL